MAPGDCAPLPRVFILSRRGSRHLFSILRQCQPLVAKFCKDVLAQVPCRAVFEVFPVDCYRAVMTIVRCQEVKRETVAFCSVFSMTGDASWPCSTREIRQQRSPNILRIAAYRRCSRTAILLAFCAEKSLLSHRSSALSCSLMGQETQVYRGEAYLLQSHINDMATQAFPSDGYAAAIQSGSATPAAALPE